MLQNYSIAFTFESNAALIKERDAAKTSLMIAICVGEEQSISIGASWRIFTIHRAIPFFRRYRTLKNNMTPTIVN